MTRKYERQGRQAETTQSRRRRDDSNFQASQKLAIPEEVSAKLEAEGRTPRWVNDTGNRMHQLTKLDDYDKVEGVEPVRVDTDKEGKPIYAHLLSKPNAFIQEDRRKADERRRETERAMVKGNVPSAPGAEPAPRQGALGADVYVDSASSIGRGNQIIE